MKDEILNPKFAHLTRQIDVLPPELLKGSITIVGCGAIGSWVTLALAKMGYTNISVYDHDTVNIENMNAQCFRFRDIGHNKAEALRDVVQDFTQVRIKAFPEKFEGKDVVARSGLLITAVDRMDVRKKIWEIAKTNYKIKAVIDPRMSLEDCLLYVMRPTRTQDCVSYPKTLYSDSEATQEPCTAKATAYTANMISGLVCKAIKNITVGEPYPRVVQWSIKSNAISAWEGAFSNGTVHKAE